MRNYLILAVFMTAPNMIFAAEHEEEVANSIVSSIASHIVSNVPVWTTVKNSATAQAIATVFIIPLIPEGYLNPKDEVAMTVFRDVTNTPGLIANINTQQLFKAGGENIIHDPSHLLAHSTKIIQKFVVPHALNTTLGTDLELGSRIALYSADASTRFFVMWGAYMQQDPAHLQTGYFTIETVNKRLLEAMPGSLMVVLINDKILRGLGVTNFINNGIDYSLSWLPGNASESIYNQSSNQYSLTQRSLAMAAGGVAGPLMANMLNGMLKIWIPTAVSAGLDSWGITAPSGALLAIMLPSFPKQFLSIFANKVISNYIFMILHPSIMNGIKKIPEGPYKTGGVVTASLILLEWNHEFLSNIVNFLSATRQIANEVYTGSGQDD
ncbi:MAG: hypothetical protein JKY15_03290 [Deltaproteobacteria bacterium]|nr:hypothetical protein [Deltaproteobacteria bacterium]